MAFIQVQREKFKSLGFREIKNFSFFCVRECWKTSLHYRYNFQSQECVCYSRRYQCNILFALHLESSQVLVVPYASLLQLRWNKYTVVQKVLRNRKTRAIVLQYIFDDVVEKPQIVSWKPLSYRLSRKPTP